MTDFSSYLYGRELAKRIQDKAFEFQEEIIAAGLGIEKARHLQEADIRLRQLQVYIRMSLNLKFITVGQYEHVAKMTVEIGKILGGWRKVEKPHRSQRPVRFTRPEMLPVHET
jgi:hypothetical protein